MPQTTGFDAPVLLAFSSISFSSRPSFTKSDIGDAADRFGGFTSRTARSVRDFHGFTNDTQSGR